MSYALIINDAVAQHPYSFSQLRRDNPDVSFPSTPSDETLASLGVFKVHPSDKPAHDSVMQNVAEVDPVLVNGQWVQGWAIEAATAEQTTERQQEADDRDARVAVRADNFVTAFVGMSPAQVAAYVENNTANLAGVRALLKKMALMLLILARRELRDGE